MKSRSSGKRGGRGARLGQHFLTNSHYAAALAKAVGILPGEAFLEIGPGTGALTLELLKHGPVVAIEKDAMLIELLQKKFAGDIASGRLRLVGEDVRNSSPEGLGLGPYVVAANIPYYITGEIIRQFLTASHQPRAMALLIQKEVAERILARDGKESILSLSVKAYGTPRIIAKVGRGNFSPPPSVDSAILLIEAVSRDRFVDVSEAVFFRTVRAGFASKRKFLANNLAAIFAKAPVTNALAACGISEKSRAEDIPLDAWFELSRYFRTA